MLSRELSVEDKEELPLDNSSEAYKVTSVLRKGWLIICASLFSSLLLTVLYSRSLSEEWVSKAIITETSVQSIGVLIEGFATIADQDTAKIPSDLFEDVLTQISLTVQAGNSSIKANTTPRGPRNVLEINFISNSSEGAKQGLLSYLNDLNKRIMGNRLAYLSSLKDARLRKIEIKLSFYSRWQTDNSDYLKLLAEKSSISSLDLKADKLSAFSIYYISNDSYEKTASRKNLLLVLGGCLGLLMGYLIATYKYLGSKNF